jgi:hypothetical protein
MEIIRKLWWGLYPLPRAFWGFYVLGFFAVWLIVGIPMAIFMGYFPGLRPIFKIVALLAIWGYWAVAAVGVWRSSNDSKHYIAFWRYAARTVVLISALKVIFTVSAGGGQLFVGGIMGSWN